MGLPDFGEGITEPPGTTAGFGFLGFFTSLFPRIWPFAMMILLATALKDWVCHHAQTQHKLIIGRRVEMGALFHNPLNLLYF